MVYCQLPLTRKQWQASWTATYQIWLRQTWTLRIESNSGPSKWLSAEYKLTGPVVREILSVPASQAFVERIFLLVVSWQQQEEIAWKISTGASISYKVNKRQFEWKTVWMTWNKQHELMNWLSSFTSRVLMNWK